MFRVLLNFSFTNRSFQDSDDSGSNLSPFWSEVWVVTDGGLRCHKRTKTYRGLGVSRKGRKIGVSRQGYVWTIKRRILNLFFPLTPPPFFLFFFSFLVGRSKKKTPSMQKHLIDVVIVL